MALGMGPWLGWRSRRSSRWGGSSRRTKNNEITLNYDFRIKRTRNRRLAARATTDVTAALRQRVRDPNCAVRNSGSATMPSTASDERLPGESDDEELPPAAGPSAPGPRSRRDGHHGTVTTTARRAPPSSTPTTTVPNRDRRARARRVGRRGRRPARGGAERRARTGGSSSTCWRKYEVAQAARRSGGGARPTTRRSSTSCGPTRTSVRHAVVAQQVPKANHFRMSELAKKNLLRRTSTGWRSAARRLRPAVVQPARRLDALRAWVSPLKRKPTLIVSPTRAARARGSSRNRSTTYRRSRAAWRSSTFRARCSSTGTSSTCGCTSSSSRARRSASSSSKRGWRASARVVPRADRVESGRHVQALDELCDQQAPLEFEIDESGEGSARSRR